MQSLDTFPTPFFVLDEAKVVASVASIRASLKQHWANYGLAFSVKTNSMPCLLEILQRENVLAEVVSDFEFELAEECSFAPANCICNGASKSEDYIARAIKRGALLHLDSVDEVRTLARLSGDAPVRFGVRVNATEADMAADPVSGPLGSRFGLSLRDGDLDELDEILRQTPRLSLVSLHLHCNTRGRSVQGYIWLAQFFARLVKTRGYKAVTTLDIGGSFGHDFDSPSENERRWPSWDEYFSGIAEALKAEGFSPDTFRLVIEPGTALIAGCADYYARVIGKRVFNGERVLQIDGSRLHVDPHLTRESFRGAISLVNRGDSTEAQSSEPIAYLSGATCHEKDRLLFEGSLAHAHRGDLVKISKAGAYSYGLAPFFFILGAPAVVLKQTDGRYSLAQRPLSARDYWRILSPADGELNSKK